MAQTKDVDTTATNGTVSQITPHERFVEYAQRRAEIEGAQVGEKISGDVLDRILTAGSIDEIWDADSDEQVGSISSTDFVDVEHMIHSFTMAPSSDEFDTRLGIFVTINATLLQEYDGMPVGTEVQVSASSSGVIGKLRMFEQAGAFPIAGVLKSRKTGKGTLIQYRRVPNRALTVKAE